MKKRLLCMALVVLMVCAMLPQVSITADAKEGFGPVIEGVLGQRDFLWPVPGYYGLSSCFYDNRIASGETKEHYAIDIPTGGVKANIVASYDGNVCEITYNGSSDGGYGNAVMVKHNYVMGNGETITLYSRYAHMDSIQVEMGQPVVAGKTVLGKVGGSGYGGTPYPIHLDFQILTSTAWRQRESCSIDPYANNLLQLPSGIYKGGTTDCCQRYIDLAKEQYATPISYLGRCTFYPAYCAIKVSSSTTYIKSLPCSEETDASSVNVEKAYKGDQYQAIGLVENTAGNLWYKVTAKNGSVGYMYAGDTTYIAQSINDIKGSGITAPTNHTAGASFVLTGSVSSTYNQLTAVSVYVYAGASEQGGKETGDTAAVSNNYYSLGGSSIDKNTKFGILPVGTHTFAVWASYKNYYAKTAKSLGTNTGEIGIYKAVFNVTSAAASCSHSYSSKVTAAATCNKNGVRTYTCSKCSASYTEVIPATGNHSYSSKVTMAATCTSNGVKTYTCSGCSASYTESIPATGHSYGSWVTTSAATCTAAGTQKRTCSSCGNAQTQSISATGHSYGSWITTSNPGCITAGSQKRTCSSCGNVQTQSISSVGHNYQSSVIAATCTDYEKIRYTCSRCQDYYEEYTSERYSDWSTTKPTGIAEELIETKTQYRYADYETRTSYETALSGYTLIGSTWEGSGSGTVQYVKSWPSGFNASHSLYATYNKSANTNSETTTSKTTVNSDKITGYLYYHWCRGTYTGGPINRATSPTQTGEFSSFHAFYSTTPPSSLTASSDGDGSYTYGNSSCCKDSHWYYCISVYTQTYTTYRKLFTYGRWGDWSSWSDTVYSANSSRKVETRTLYRYVNSQLGDHVWNSGVVTTAPTCTATGVKAYTCTACGETKTETIAKLNHSYENGYCTACGTLNPDYQFVTAQIAVDDVTATAGDTITVPVRISDNTGFAGFTFIINYDSSAMTLTNITKGYVLNMSESGSFTTNISGNTLNWTDTTNSTSDGVIFELTFKIADIANIGDYSVSVALKDNNSTNFVDEHSTAKPLEMKNGTISIYKHTHVYESKTAAPTCTEQGYTTHICSACGDSYVDSYTDVLPHTYGEWTYADTGTHQRTCSCGAREIAAHDFSNNLCACSVYSGICGDDLTWILNDSSGVLTISGTGAMSIWEAAPWDDFKSYIKTVEIAPGATSIGYAAFGACSNLTSVTIPDSVTIIEIAAFSGCSSLTSVTIPYGVTNISRATFRNCKKLISVIIPNSVVSIGELAFEGCNSLMSVTIPSGVTSIGKSAFYNCNSLTSVTIPDGVTSIDEYTFYDCDNLTSLTLPDGLTNIGEGAFSNCYKLTSVTISNSVTSIGSWAFSNCRSLTSMTIPDSVTSIGSYAFNGCSGLASVNISDGVTSIGKSAFSSCYALTNVTIPNSVTTIGAGSFGNCNNLKNVIILNSQCTISNSSTTLGVVGSSVIHANASSTTEDYAATYGYEFHPYNYIDNGNGLHSCVCTTCGTLGVEAEHVFVDSVCICGTTNLSLDANIKINHSLNLASDIAINYVVNAELLAGYDSYYLECVLPIYEKNELIGTETVTIQPELRGTNYYFVLDGLISLKMNNMVEATLHMEKDGKQYVSKVDSYSIATYAYNQLNGENKSEALKTMCANLLRYGAKAQLWKGYRTDALADANMTEAHKAYLNDLDAVVFGSNNRVLTDIENPAITWGGKALRLDSKVVVRFVINTTNYTGNLDDLSLRVSFVNVKGETETVTLTEYEVYDASRNFYAFDFDGLLAAELRTVMSAAVYEGDTQVSPTLEYSVDTFGNGKTDTLLTVMQAMVAYADSASAFFS